MKAAANLLGSEIGPSDALYDKPRHPYTRALLGSVPKLGSKEPLYSIPGQPPNLATLPPGCPFAPRCPQRQPVCDEAYPPDVNVSDGHTARCWMVSAA